MKMRSEAFHNSDVNPQPVSMCFLSINPMQIIKMQQTQIPSTTKYNSTGILRRVLQQPIERSNLLVATPSLELCKLWKEEEKRKKKKKEKRYYYELILAQLYCSHLMVKIKLLYIFG